MADGATVFEGHGAGFAVEPFNVNSIPPGEIAGIEYYAGAATLPAELNSTRNTCGLLVIWTRVK